MAPRGATNRWTKTDSQLPPEGELVLTRQTYPVVVQQRLRRYGDKWAFPDGIGCTQYTPDEWRFIGELEVIERY